MNTETSYGEMLEKKKKKKSGASRNLPKKREKTTMNVHKKSTGKIVMIVVS